MSFFGFVDIYKRGEEILAGANLVKKRSFLALLLISVGFLSRLGAVPAQCVLIDPEPPCGQDTPFPYDSISGCGNCSPTPYCAEFSDRPLPGKDCRLLPSQSCYSKVFFADCGIRGIERFITCCSRSHPPNTYCCNPGGCAAIPSCPPGTDELVGHPSCSSYSGCTESGRSCPNGYRFSETRVPGEECFPKVFPRTCIQQGNTPDCLMPYRCCVGDYALGYCCSTQNNNGTNGGGTNGDGTTGGGTNGDGTNGGGTNGGGTNGGGTNGGGTNGGGTNGGGTNGGGTNGDGTNGGATKGEGTNGDGTNAGGTNGDGTNGDGTNGGGTNGGGTNGDGTNGGGTKGEGTNGDGINGGGTNGDGTNGGGTNGGGTNGGGTNGGGANGGGTNGDGTNGGGTNGGGTNGGTTNSNNQSGNNSSGSQGGLNGSVGSTGSLGTSGICLDFPCIKTPTVVIVPYQCAGADYSRHLYLLNFITQQYVYRIGWQRVQWLCRSALAFRGLPAAKIKDIRKRLNRAKALSYRHMEEAVQALLNLQMYPIVQCEGLVPYCQLRYHQGYDEYLKAVRNLISVLRSAYNRCFSAVPFTHFERRGDTAKQAATFLIFKTMKFVEQSIKRLHAELPRNVYYCEIPSGGN